MIDLMIDPAQIAYEAELRRRDPHYYPGVDDDRALFDGTHALMRAETLWALPEYSCFIPTGAFPGKCWRAYVANQFIPDGKPKAGPPWRDRGYKSDPRAWLVGRYESSEVLNKLSIKYRFPLIVE